MVMHEWCMAHPWMTFIIILYALCCITALFGRDVSLIRFYNWKPEKDEKAEYRGDEKDGEADSSQNR